MKDLRQFETWTERYEENDEALTDESVVYLWDDFVVVRSPVLLGGVIFDSATPEWQDFCRITLGFEIPEDLRYAYEQNEERKEPKKSRRQPRASPLFRMIYFEEKLFYE